MKKLLFFFAFLATAHISLNAQSVNYKELLYEGRHKELIHIIQNEIPECSITGDIARTLAQAYEGLLKYRDAYTYFERWLQADTLNIDALCATARMALQLGRIQEGELLYTKAYSLDSTRFNTGLQLAKLHYQLGNYVKAYDYYYALLLQDTVNVSLLTSVGDCLNEMGEMSAIEFYEEAVALNKENSSLAIVLINTLLGYRQWAPDVFINRSMEVCDTALVYNPNSKSLLRSKGVIYYLMQNYHACDSLMSGLIEGGDSTMLNFRYVSLSKYNDNLFIEAIPYAEYYYQNDTTNTEAAMLLGISLGRTYDRKRALTLFDQVEKSIQPSEEQLYNLAVQRGHVYKANTNFAEAANHYWRAASISSSKKSATLSYLLNLYPFYNRSSLDTASDELYAKALFAYVAYLRAIQEGGSDNSRESQRNSASVKRTLSLFLEDMFFKETDRLQMWAPDGKREWVTRAEIEQLTKP